MSVLYSYDPACVGDVDHFSMSFTDFLDEGDSIASAQVVVTPSMQSTTPTIASAALVTVWLTMVNAGSYVVAFKIETTLGRTATRSVNLTVTSL